MKIGDLATLSKFTEVKSKTLLINVCFSSDKTVKIIDIHNSEITFKLTDPFNKAGEFTCNEIGVLSNYTPIQIGINPIINFWYDLYNKQ